jgi:hypothetical protein
MSSEISAMERWTGSLRTPRYVQRPKKRPEHAHGEPAEQELMAVEAEELSLLEAGQLDVHFPARGVRGGGGLGVDGGGREQAHSAGGEGDHGGEARASGLLSDGDHRTSSPLVVPRRAGRKAPQRKQIRGSADYVGRRAPVNPLSGRSATA